VGNDRSRRELAGEALFLGRLLAELLPEEPEVLGLLALMLYTEARRPARRTTGGKFVPLAQQNQALWDRARIEEAEVFLYRARAAGPIGRYQLEAAIQSAHIAGAETKSTPWDAIVTLYDALVKLTGSPVASINRSLALAELEGPSAGLAALESVSSDPRLKCYQPYWAARAHLLGRVGSVDAARYAFQIAIGLEPDPAVREYLLQCCEDLDD
jgi:RNA polymerase sigma-70 factor, ECF subfamily